MHLMAEKPVGVYGPTENEMGVMYPPGDYLTGTALNEDCQQRGWGPVRGSRTVSTRNYEKEVDVPASSG